MTPDLLPPRMAAKVHVAESGCWEWTGCHNGLGYGQVTVARKMRSAHRTSYELLVGPIPSGLEIDHLCRVRGCINPAHLEPVTHLENMRRAAEAGSWTGPRAYMQAGDFCRRGHAMTGDNLRRSRDGRRRCRECHRATDRERQRNKRTP